jgi:rhodanese-related sulfurtransferase/DNA-binding transcriptional ArsR family regulator
VSRSKGPKQQLFGQLARIAQALASDARLEILDYLAQGGRSVDDLAQTAGLSMANTSKHLQQLKGVGLVRAQRFGKQVFYRLADDRALDAIAALRVLAESHAQEVGALVASYLHARDQLEPLPAEELLARADSGLVTVLDVRPPEEFAQGHIPGALNVPLEDLKSRLRSLPRNQEVIAYCRGPWCVLSFEAVRQLRGAGFTARRLQDGMPEWRRAGYPVSTENSAQP